MTFLDRALRNWRIRMCIPFIKPADRVLDIGCLDGYFLEKLKTKPIQESIGLDPLLPNILKNNFYTLIPGTFPNDLPTDYEFNCITMLAVIEHIPRKIQQVMSEEFYKYLIIGGRIIITVPSPFVDKILWFLIKLRLIDGMSLDEHYGFNIKEIPQLFDSKKFRLIKHKKFQLGLNNLFIFEKIDNQ